MDSHTSATTPAAAPAQSPGSEPAAGGQTAGTAQTAAAPVATAPTASPAGADGAAAHEAGVEEPHAGFGSRGRLRRRARFLRKARELAYRDLGGLVFSLHRFGQRNDALVLAKLATLSRIDAELRALEDTLAERQPVTVLREAGITACPRCAAIHSGEDRFCPSCGLSMSRRSDLPIAGAAAASTVQASPAQGPAARPSPPPAPQPPAPQPPAPQPGAGAPSAQAPMPPPAPQPTQAFDAVPAGGAGRSPLPPRQNPVQTPPGEDEQPTEIIRPRASGS